jgi:hypothetical protein
MCYILYDKAIVTWNGVQIRARRLDLAEAVLLTHKLWFSIIKGNNNAQIVAIDVIVSGQSSFIFFVPMFKE